MKISAVILVVLFVVSGVFYYNFTVEKPHKHGVFVARVIDGDTVETNESVRVRLKGVNTPETGYFESAEAKAFLEGLVLDRDVELESTGEDKYGRTLGYLFLDGDNVNLDILKNGHASLYYYEEDGYYDEMKEAEAFAMENKLGIWKESEDYGCLKIVEFSYTEPEFLKLDNSCNFNMEVTIKDDATHIYNEVLEPGIFELNTSHIWNNEGDSIYIWDKKGLLIFHRY